MGGSDCSKRRDRGLKARSELTPGTPPARPGGVVQGIATSRSSLAGVAGTRSTTVRRPSGSDAVLTVLAVTLAASLLTALLSIAGTAETRVLSELAKGGPLSGIKVAAATPDPAQIGQDDAQPGDFRQRPGHGGVGRVVDHEDHGDGFAGVAQIGYADGSLTLRVAREPWASVRGVTVAWK